MAIRSPTGPFVGIWFLFHLALAVARTFVLVALQCEGSAVGALMLGHMMSAKVPSLLATSASLAAELLSEAGPSIGLFPREVAREQASNGVFRFGEFLLAAPQGGLKADQLSSQIGALSSVCVLANVCASRWPYFDQALGREHPDGGLSRVLGDVMNVPELPVRRHARTWRVRSVPDLGPEDICETSAREPVRAWRRHGATIAACLKTVLDDAAAKSYCPESDELS
jgi:hypothetical protein